jgi:hypothetical protein
MEGFFYVLFFVTLSFSLLSVEEIQKRLEKACETEEKHIESERMIFVNSIIDVLENAIINGKIFRSFSRKDDSVTYDGQFGDIRPNHFCKWWEERFKRTTCSYNSHVIDIGFEQKK